MTRDNAIVVAVLAVLGLATSAIHGWSIAEGVCVLVLVAVMAVTAPMDGGRARWRQGKQEKTREPGDE